MKTRNILSLMLITVILASCGSSTSLGVLRPADIDIPSHVQTIVIIERDINRLDRQILEGIFSGEGIFEDRRATDNAKESLYRTLARSDRYKVIRSNIELDEKFKSPNEAYAPLEWAQLEDIAEDYNADAVLSIEMYDTDRITRNYRSTRRVRNANGNYVNVPTTEQERNIFTDMSVRLYDMKKKNIIDDHTVRAHARNTTQNNGYNNSNYYGNNGSFNTTAISYTTGSKYAARIAPLEVTVRRAYFTGKGADMRTATKYARDGHWGKAANKWQTVLRSNANQKNKAKAAFNLAVANEVMGNLDAALDWAIKSYEKYDFNKSRYYITALEYRIEMEERALAQLAAAE